MVMLRYTTTAFRIHQIAKLIGNPAEPIEQYINNVARTETPNQTDVNAFGIASTTNGDVAIYHHNEPNSPSCKNNNCTINSGSSQNKLAGNLKMGWLGSFMYLPLVILVHATARLIPKVAAVYKFNKFFVW